MNKICDYAHLEDNSKSNEDDKCSKWCDICVYFRTLEDLHSVVLFKTKKYIKNTIFSQNTERD